MNKIFVLMVGCLLLAACQSTVNTVENRDKNMQRNVVDTSKISTDGFLRRRLQIKRVDKVELSSGLLKVQVTAQNIRTGFFDQIATWFMGDNPYQITYRFTWLDKDGMEVNNGTQSWIPMTVLPGDTVRFLAMSPNSRCKDFTLSLRENSDARSQ